MKRFLAILLTLAMVLSMVPAMGHTAHAETTTEADIEPFYGLGWSDINRSKFTNLDGMPTIAVGNSSGTVTLSYGGKTDPAAMAETMKSVMDSYPAGMRYIMLYGTAKAFKASEEAGLHVYADEGMGQLKTLFTAFIQAYAEIGGKLDGLILDTEYINMGSWYIYSEEYYGDDGVEEDNLQIYNQIVADSRYATEIRPLLEERGFVFYEDVNTESGGVKSEIYSIWPNQYFKGEEKTKYSSSPSIWNTVMSNRIAAYLNDAVYAPLAEQYPDAIMSDYQETDLNAWMKTMSSEGNKSWIGGNSVKVGNTSNGNSYQYRPNDGFYTDTSGNYLYKNPVAYNDAVYERSSYNMFAVDVNRFKEYYASTENKQLNAWIAEYDYNEGTGTASNTPYYAETILHLGMLNPKPFLIYMYRSAFASQEVYDARAQVISELLSELTRVAGYSDRKPIETPAVWNQGFMLSGMYTGGRNLWRITPDTTNGMTVEEFLVTEEAPTFSINGVTVTFPQGRIIADSEISVVGTCGYWVETPADVEPIYAYAEDRYAENPSYVEDFDYADGTVFNSENANEKQAWEADADLTVQGGALALTGTATLNNVKLPKNITAGDNYAMQQAWEVSFTLPEHMTSGTVKLLNDAFTLAANEAGNGTEIRYLDVVMAELQTGVKYTVKVDNDFAANTATYTLSANGAVVATAVDSVSAEYNLPVETIGFAATGVTTTVLVDDYKLYPTGLAEDLEIYNAETGIQITAESTTAKKVAYRVSWLNATEAGKKANVVATIGGEQTVVGTVEMAANADGVVTGIIENADGAELTVALVDDGAYTPETAPEGGDFDWVASVPTIDVEAPEATESVEVTFPSIPDPEDPVAGEDVNVVGTDKAGITIGNWDAQHWNVTYGGAPSYRVCYSAPGYTADGVENGTLWRVTKTGASADNWNLKFEWPVGGVPTLTLRDVTYDVIGDDGTTLYEKTVTTATDETTGETVEKVTYSGYTSRTFIMPSTNYPTRDLKIVLEGKNRVESNYGILRDDASAKFGDITFTSVDGGSLSGFGGTYTISANSGNDLIFDNANITIEKAGKDAKGIPFRGNNGSDIYIINSNVSVANPNHSAIATFDGGNIYIHRSTVNATATTISSTEGTGAINAVAGTVTVSGNSKITVTGNLCCGIYGNQGVTIDGGELNITADEIGINGVNGDITVNGGIVKIVADPAMNEAPVLADNIIGWYGPDADNLDFYNVAKYGAKCVIFEGHTHNEVAIPAMAPTCTKAGREGDGLVCLECGEIQVESTVIPSTGHTMVAADCETAAHCINCDYTEGEALGHTEVILPAVAATCQSTGLTEGKYCSVCNKYLVFRETTEKLAHTEVEIPAVEATETKYGWTAGTKCSVCDEILVAQERIPALNAGATLDATYTIKFGYSSYNLTKYDTPIYFVSAEITTLPDTEGNAFTAYSPVSVQDPENWNAKLIWHTGDEGPTLYLDGFKYDLFNEESGKWMVVSATNSGANIETAITPDSDAPITIVLQGEDSVIKTKFGIPFGNDVTFKSEGDTKLTAYMASSFLRGTAAGAGVTFDHANVDVNVVAYYTTNHYHISVAEADIVIKGGKVNLTTTAAKLYPLHIRTSGNVYISDGADVYVKGGYYGMYSAAEANLYVDNANLIIIGSYGGIQTNQAYKAPVVADGFCVQLKQGQSADTAKVVEAFDVNSQYGKIYFEVNRHSLTEVAEVPATCDAEGTVRHWHCEVCGKNFADELGTVELAHTVLVGGHTWADATCTAPKTCTRCGLTDGEKLGHDVVILPAVAATCLETGLTEGQYCDRCGETFVYREVTPLAGHTEEVIPGKAATATETGLTDGKKCSVCGEILVKQEIIPVLGGGTDLPEEYTLKFGYNYFTLTKYDTPIYFVTYETDAVTDTAVLATNEDGTTVGNVFTTYGVTTTKDTENWNAKLIWYTGDEGPTLYMDGFKYDQFNEESGLWRRKSLTEAAGAEETAITADDTRPLTIVLQGEDSVIKTKFGITFKGDLTIKGEGDTKLTAHTGVGFLRGNAAGAGVTLDNVNLDCYVQYYYGNNWYNIRVNAADIVIKGGKVNLTTDAAKMYPLYISTSGNLYISDGAVVDVKAGYYGVIMPAASEVYVDQATLRIQASYNAIYQNSKGAAPIVADGFCATLKHGTTAATAVVATEIPEGVANGKNTRYIAVLYHDLTEIAEVPATCAAAGTAQHWSCVTCGKLFADAEATQEITADDLTITADHNWIDATCTEPKTCPTCGLTEGAPLGHIQVVVPAKAATCAETGLTEGKKCMYCDKVIVAQEEIEMLEHTYDTVPGKDPTCAEPGLTEGEQCSVCGEWSVEQEEIETVDHEWTYLEDKEPTCTEPGLTEGEACAVCGEVSVEQEVIEAYGHTEEVVPGKAATCTEPGLTDGKKCTVCGETTVAQEEIPATGHTEEVIPGKEATETEPGLTEGKKCSVCGEILVAQEEIPATGCKHTETTTTESVVDATCTAAGSKTTTVTCTCGEVISTETVEIPALGHAFTDYVADGNGYKVASCDNGCGTTDSKIDEASFDVLANVTVAENGQVKLKVRNPALLKEVFMYYIADNAYTGQTGLVTWKTSMHKQLLSVTKAVNDVDVNGADGYRTYGMTDLPQLTKTGTYVFRVRYYENNVERMLVQVIDVESIDSEATVPTVESVTDVDVSAGGKILFTIDSPATLTKVYIYYIGDNECPIPTGEITWKSSYHTTLTKYTLAEENAAVNGSEGYRAYAIDNMPKLTRNGNYVFRIRYVLDGTTYYNVKEVNVENLEYSFDMDYAVDGRVLLTGDNEYVSRVDIYYIGNNECPIPTGDIAWKSSYFTTLTNYSKAEENIGVNGTAGYIAYDRTKLPRLNTLGTYVLRVRYTDPNGVAKDRVYTKTFTEVEAPLTYDVAFDANGQMSLVGETDRVRKIVAYYVGTNGYTGETGEMAYFTTALQKELLALGKANPAAFGAGGYRSFAPSNMPVLTVEGDYVFRVIYRDVDGVEKSYIVHKTLG